MILGCWRSKLTLKLYGCQVSISKGCERTRMCQTCTLRVPGASRPVLRQLKALNPRSERTLNAQTRPRPEHPKPYEAVSEGFLARLGGEEGPDGPPSARGTLLGFRGLKGFWFRGFRV